MAERDNLLTLLRTRIDRTVMEIIFEIQLAVYYQFSEVNGTWNKGDIEGPLILVKRSQEPHYGLIILNKQNQNNFYQQITSEILFEKKIPQLLCIRDKNKNVYGVWSSNADLIEHLFKKLQEIQNIDSQSKMLKSLLEIGPDSAMPAKSSDSMLNSKSLEFKPHFAQEDILKPEFFQNGVVFSEKNEQNFNREKIREVIISLAHSDEFLNLIMQALQSRGISFNS